MDPEEQEQIAANLRVRVTPAHRALAGEEREDRKDATADLTDLGPSDTGRPLGPCGKEGLRLRLGSHERKTPSERSRKPTGFGY